MPDKPSLRQQSNNQTQAGAAAQLVVNIFLVTADGANWTVKPIAFHTESSVAPPRPGTGGDSPEGGVDIDMEAGRRSNAQGQGLTVVNDVSLLEVLGRALDAAAGDMDIQRALTERR